MGSLKERQMRIAIGADHGGFKLKKKLIEFLKAKGHVVADLGTHSEKSCDYPSFGYKVAKAVSNGEFSRGILICKSGLGMSMVANKAPGIRAAVCRDIKSAVSSRKHNNANVLTLGAAFTTEKLAKRILSAWLAAEFEGGRHARRVRQIRNIEKK